MIWRSERACASAATIRSSKWKSAIGLWYVRFYLEAIGGACRVQGRGFEPRCGTFFFPSSFFPLSFFSPSFFLSPGFFFFLLLSIPFKLAPPLQCSSIFLVSFGGGAQRGMRTDRMAARLWRGGGCGRGVCPLPHKV